MVNTGFRLKFRSGTQRRLFLDILSKEKLTQRNLAGLLGCSREGVKNWANDCRMLPEYIFDYLEKMFPWVAAYRNNIVGKVPLNWGQIRGGKIRSKMKNNLTNNDRIKGFRHANKITFKRKVVGPKGERMYNNGEKRIADLLFKNGFDYSYEPVINLGERYAIPDFVVGGNIIERCGYSNWDVYWSNAVRKFKLLRKCNSGKVILVIPSKHIVFAFEKLHKLKGLIILEEEHIEVLKDLLKGSSEGS
jgi:hypothetical protein